MGPQWGLKISTTSTAGIILKHTTLRTTALYSDGPHCVDWRRQHRYRFMVTAGVSYRGLASQHGWSKRAHFRTSVGWNFRFSLWGMHAVTRISQSNQTVTRRVSFEMFVRHSSNMKPGILRNEE